MEQQKIIESLQQLINTVSRIDERTSALVTRFDDLESKVEKHNEQILQLSERVAILETRQTHIEIAKLKSKQVDFEMKLQRINIDTTSHKKKFENITGWVLSVGQAIAIAYILFKLNLH